MIFQKGTRTQHILRRGTTIGPYPSFSRVNYKKIYPLMRFHAVQSKPSSMGNISTSFTIPCPKTTCYRVAFWTARKLRLRNFEISYHQRRSIQTTINLDRARTPAATLRQLVNNRLDGQPDTMAIFWTGPDDINTALSVFIPYI